MYQPFVKIRLDCGPPTRPSRQATPRDETLRLGFHQPNQTAEAPAVFRSEIPEREETHAMFDDPALAFNQEGPNARGQLLEKGSLGSRQSAVQQVRHEVIG
jgi:hypothetical protein